jgi:hypothetical protein
MLAHAVRILVVGPLGPRLGPLLDRLAREGWEAYRLESNTEARTVLRTLQFDLVLATEDLSDGTGYDLAYEVGRRSASLFVEVGMSDGQVWLPVMEQGTRTMGQGALDLADLEWEVKRILSGAAPSDPIGESVHVLALEAVGASGLASAKRPDDGASRAVLAAGFETTRKSNGKASA